MILGKLGISLICGVVAAGGVSSEGFIHVKVHESSPNGTHLTLIVPGVLVLVGLRFVPRDRLQDASSQVQQWMPLLRTSLEALRDEPDMTYVEITEPGEHVLVSKQGGSVVVDAESPEETVHVSAPLRAIESSLEQIAVANPKA